MNNPPAHIPASRVLRMARLELRTYGDTAQYRKLIALWNRQLTWEAQS